MCAEDAVTVPLNGRAEERPREEKENGDVLRFD